MIHCANSTDALVTLESMESWKTLLHAACICNYQRNLEVSKEHGREGGFISLLPQKLLDCTHHEEGFRENTEIRIQGKGFT